MGGDMARVDQRRMLLPLHAITLDPELQPRAELDQALLGEFTAALANGAIFPPVIVFEHGGAYLLSDGYHRWHAYDAAKLEPIETEVRQGDWQSALRWSLSANAKH